MEKRNYHIEAIRLASGDCLEDVNLAYHIHNEDGKGKVVWVFHALTANSNPLEWWADLLKKASWLNLEEDVIICANLLGSCYGTHWGKAYNDRGNLIDIPLITVRDNVAVFEQLRQYLSIDQIHIGIGGSLGGSQLLEWNIMHPSVFEKSILLACSPKESSWGKAAHYAQRRAIEADPNFKTGNWSAIKEGLKVARTIGMLTYRSRACFEHFQQDEDGRISDFKVESYLAYQEERFLERFDAQSYYILSKTLDTHDIERDRSNQVEVLAEITSKTLVIGIETDMLCPIEDQKILANHIPQSELKIIDSIYGHDGFLVEYKIINETIRDFLKQ